MSGEAENPGAIIMRWWRANLRPEDDTSSARALRARLRRADRALDVLCEPAVIALHQALGARSPRDPRDLAALVTVLAGIETYTSQRLARAFGVGEEPALSNLRFQRLIRSQDRPALAVALRRALPFVGRACNVAALGEDFLRWGEAVRIRWCFDYFGKASPPEGKVDATAADIEGEPA